MSFFVHSLGGTLGFLVFQYFSPEAQISHINYRITRSYLLTAYYTKYIYVFLQTFEAMRSVMLQKGNVFLEKMMTARGKIATKGAERLPDGAVSCN